MTKGGLCAAIAPLLVVGCATFAPQLSDEPSPRFEQPQPLAQGDLGVALVLSGGAARGYAHIGVIRVLEAHGLMPSMVIGSSAGSIVGSLYASGLSSVELEKAMAELSRGSFDDFVLPSLGFFPGEKGFIKGDKLHRFIDDRARHHLIEHFPIRFAAVATDLQTGELQIFNAGDVGAAVRASTAVPGIIAPAEIAGRLYGDGQISSPVPAGAARRPQGDRGRLPARGCIHLERARRFFQTFAISVHRLKRFELSHADLVISPELPRTSDQMSFSDRDRLIAAGELAALRALKDIRPPFQPVQSAINQVIIRCNEKQT